MTATSRRAILAGLATVPIVAAAVTPAVSVPDDPIFAAIERHRQLFDAAGRASVEADAAMEASCGKGFSPAWRDLPAAVPFAEAELDAFARLAEIELELACIRPTTPAGIAAIMAYSREHEQSPTAMYELFLPDECAGDERRSKSFWLRTIEEAARSLADVHGERRA